MKKIIISCMLLISVFSIIATSFADENAAYALKLKEFDVFQGTGNGFELNRPATRVEGLVMFIRLLGKETEALASSYDHPFTDVPTWANNYVGWAFEKGYTNGISSTEFGSRDINAKSYLTFVLRALGYDEEKNDFTWENAVGFSESIGLINTEEMTQYNSILFLRDHIAKVSYDALKTRTKSNIQLNEILGISDDQLIIDETVVITPPASTSPIGYEDKSITLDSGIKTIKLVTVDLSSPKIRLEVALPNDTLNVTQSLEEQAKSAGAYCSVDANFFMSYTDTKDPIGNVMIDGVIQYGQSAITTLGITADKNFDFSFPTTMVAGGVDGKYANVKTGNTYTYHQWYTYEINTMSQFPSNIILYTPFRGETVDITVPGTVTVVKNNMINDVITVTNVSNDTPKAIAIPKDGYLIYHGYSVAAEDIILKALTPGRSIEYKYDLKINENPNFDWTKYQYAISGEPRLVKDGAIYTGENHPMFSGERFTTMSTSRTAIGITADGKMLLLSGSNLTITDLKQVMFKLGAVDAVNLDGGGSTGLYYNGEMKATPGRELTTVLHVFYDK